MVILANPRQPGTMAVTTYRETEETGLADLNHGDLNH